MREKKTVFKLFFVWDFEKEERWLNEMVQEGWVLDNTGFSFYTFVRCEPGEYIIRLEMNPSSDYRAFVKELGAEYIGGCVNWVYFRRKAELGSFELLSDIDSRLTHLSRINRMLSLLCLANLILGITNSLNQARYGWLNLLCAAMLSYALGRIHGMKAALEKERSLHDGVPKVHYSYCSMRGAFFACESRSLEEAQRLCENWLVGQDRCYRN